MALYLNRRQKLSACIGALGIALLGRSSVVAHADQSAVDQLIAQFTRGKTPTAGRVTLELPSATDEGGTIVLSVLVDVPLGAHVTDVIVVADGNKSPGVVIFHFSPMSVVEAATRIRLAAGEQRVTAVARLSDGSCYAVTEKVTVMKNGCF